MASNIDGPTEEGPPRRSLLRAVTVLPLAGPLSKRGRSAGRGGAGEREGPSDELEVGDTVLLDEVIRPATGYALTLEAPADGTVTTISGRVHGADRYFRSEHGEVVSETYLVDGTVYVVTEAGCRMYPVEEAFAGPSRGKPADPTLEVVGRRTIDGRPVLVLEFAGGPPTLPQPAQEARREQAKGRGVARQRTRDGVKFFVDEQSGRLRRVERDSVVIDYRDWGGVEPISPPEC